MGNVVGVFFLDWNKLRPGVAAVTERLLAGALLDVLRLAQISLGSVVTLALYSRRVTLAVNWRLGVLNGGLLVANLLWEALLVLRGLELSLLVSYNLFYLSVWLLRLILLWNLRFKVC